MTEIPAYLRPFVLTASDEAGPEAERVGELDVYRPAEPGRRPAVLFVHGGPGPFDLKVFPRDWPLFQGYAKAVAERGLVGAVVDHPLVLGMDQLTAASDQVEAAVGRLRADEHVDPERILLWFFSGGGLLAGEWIDSRPEWLRGIALSYPVLDGPGDLISATEVVGNHPDLPILLTRPGKEQEALAAAVQAFVDAAGKAATLRVIDVPNGRHAFDVLDPTEQSRSAVRAALDWAVSVLLPDVPGSATRTRSTRSTTPRKSPVTTPVKTSASESLKTTIAAPAAAATTAGTTTRVKPAPKPSTPAKAPAAEETPAAEAPVAEVPAETAAPTPEAVPSVPSVPAVPSVPPLPPVPVLADSPAARVVARQLSAFLSHDLEAFLSLYSPTARVFLADGKEVPGRRALREYYGPLVESATAWIEVETRLTEGEWVVDQQVLHGVGPQPVRSIVVHRVQNRAIVEVRHLA
ncbi:nuclear transport factor 2 family protein [Kribbella deserti]|uniref:Nuclear transport factor 2 family protein n=1 Tax=Kribbella deserti TaxID=1926257 RepID=A0ABV6QVQ9_9ACTN